MAASVEDFPEPVGAGDKYHAIRRSTISFSVEGRWSSSNPGILSGTTRMTMAQLPRCLKNIDAKPGNSGDSVGKIGGAFLLELPDSRFILTHDFC